MTILMVPDTFNDLVRGNSNGPQLNLTGFPSTQNPCILGCALGPLKVCKNTMS